MIKGDELTSVEVKILDESTTAISRYRVNRINRLSRML